VHFVGLNCITIYPFYVFASNSAYFIVDN